MGEINFELKFDDFIEQLVASPEFKYNFYRMWLRSILVSWATEMTGSDLFDHRSGIDILPLWMSYVIRKLQASHSEECKLFVRFVRKDVKRLYDMYETVGWKCFAKDVTQQVNSEVSKPIQLNNERGEGDSDEISFDTGSDGNFQLFSDQFTYLLIFIERTFSTCFKFRLFVMAFGTKIEKEPQEVVMPYRIPFPKKYLIPHEAELYKIAKFPSQLMIEVKGRFGPHSKSMTFEVDDKSIEEQDETQGDLTASGDNARSCIVPLSQALNITDEFWAAYKAKTHNSFS